jgi:hypothetical protein
MVGQPNRFEQCSLLFGETDSFDDVFDQNGLTPGNVSEQIRTFWGYSDPKIVVRFVRRNTGV